MFTMSNGYCFLCLYREDQDGNCQDGGALASCMGTDAVEDGELIEPKKAKHAACRQRKRPKA